MTLSDLRRDYQGEPLDETTASADPLELFERWLGAARGPEVDPTAMALATCDLEGRPSVRMVLLKGLDARGLVFYTNYESRKGSDLAANANASVLFYWASLNRQVRVDGIVQKVSAGESDAYFRSRPAESRIAALVSAQSQALESRAHLEQLFAEALERVPDANVERPEFWGGYRLIPRAVEFWQGRPNRLHDRLRYERGADGTWKRVRLAP